MSIRPLRWMKETGKRSKFRRSKVEENRVAGTLGGRRAVMSGAARVSAHSDETEGADIKVREVGTANLIENTMGLRLHLEHKRTATPQMRVQREWFSKVNAASRRTAGQPAVALLFETLSGSRRDWLGVPVGAFRTWFPVARWKVLEGTPLEMKGASVTIQAAWLDKVGTAPPDEGAVPSFVLTLTGARAMPVTWVFVPLEKFKAMKEDE